MAILIGKDWGVYKIIILKVLHYSWSRKLLTTRNILQKYIVKKPIKKVKGNNKKLIKRRLKKKTKNRWDSQIKKDKQRTDGIAR